ncbi:AAA family ATPase [Vibrio campbellii]|uniref:AAA family ATPase n=1 Tax=Vibrio campbellii TaxID=680 RepID=UPI0037363F5E
MKLDLKINNLGKIKNADLSIADITVITGPNGTGKSFVTKFLYSVFSSIENYSVWGFCRNYILKSIAELKSFADENEAPEALAYITPLDELLTGVFSIHSQPNDYVSEKLLLGQAVDVITQVHKSLVKDFDITMSEGLVSAKKDHNDEVDLSILMVVRLLSQVLMVSKFEDVAYKYYLNTRLNNEIKENFQIQDFDEIISFGEKEMTLSLGDIIDIGKERDNEDIYVGVKSHTIDFFRSKPNSIFFESPAYWRVRSALLESKLNTRRDFLTGVPKYFFDLDKSLQAKNKHESDLFAPIYNKLKSTIGGEFVFEGSELIFKDDITETSLSKNLVSFGMTNIGMLNALLKNNVIRKGSFIFIDEPETNLHPDWQSLMMEALFMLASNGVKVILTTHSLEILKKLEVEYTNNDSLDLAVNYLDTDGEHFPLTNDDSSENLIQARELLGRTYYKLYMEQD